MAARFWTTLKFRLPVLVTMTLLAGIGLIFYSTVQQREGEREDLRQENVRLVRLLATEQDQWVEDARQLLASLAQIPEIQAPTTSGCSLLLGDLLKVNSAYANLGVALPDGSVVCSAIPLTTPVSAANRTWFQRALASNSFASGDYQIGTITGRPTINFGLPVKSPAGALIGVLFTALDLRWLNERVAEASLPADGVFIVIDGNGTVLARAPHGNEWFGQPLPDPALLHAVLSAGTGTAEVEDVDGVVRVYAFTPLSASGTADPHAAYLAIGVPVGPALAHIDRLFAANLITTALFGVALIGVVWIVTNRTVIHNLDMVVRAAHRVAEGDFHARTGVAYSAGEVGNLARSFDDMAAALERLVAKERILDELQRKDAELRARLDEIELLNRELRRRNEELDEFAHVISHDLKAPLRAITHLSQWIEEDEKTHLKPDSLENLHRLQNRARRLHEMIDAFLQVARAGRTGEDRADIDLGALLKDVADLVTAPPGFRIVLPPDLPHVRGSRERLQRVFQNLFQNAYQHHDRPDGRVEVQWRETPTAFEFTLTDDGPGIPAEVQERVFRPFETYGPARERGSTGIGLAVVKKVLESEGGWVRLESGPGRGATFRLSWPKDRVPPA